MRGVAASDGCHNLAEAEPYYLQAWAEAALRFLESELSVNVCCSMFPSRRRTVASISFAALCSGWREEMQEHPGDLETSR